MSTWRTVVMAAVCLGVPGQGICASDFSHHVPPPWTPVTVKAGPGEQEIGVWGRTYRFDKSPLPTSMTTAGEELLAAPVRIVGSTDGKPLEWRRSGAMVAARSEGQVTLAGWRAGDSLILNTAVRVDFDGMMRVDLVVSPQRGTSPRLERLWLEAPLKQSRATLFHYWPGRWGRAENSGTVAQSGLTLPFKPLVWLGWEDGGLAWFAESDKRWQPLEDQHAIEVIRNGEETVLRVRLLDSSPPNLPLTFTVGFQATPVKPWPADFHEWRIWHAPQLGVSLSKPAWLLYPEWRICHRAFPDGNFAPVLERAAELGVKTVVFHEDWTPFENYPVTTQEEELREMAAACHRRGMKLLLYYGKSLSTLAPEWAELADDVLVENSKGLSPPSWHRLPEQRTCAVCYRSRCEDLLVEGVARALDRYGCDGVYLDGTIEPMACCNKRHGCGYRTAAGALRPTYPVFAVRRMMQRLYGLIHPRGGLINAHQSTCCFTPTLAFVDSYWDGEQFSRGELSGDPMQKLPLAAFRAEFMGRNFGVPCEFLAYEQPPDWTADHALAFTMLHDVRVRPHGSGPLLEQMSKLWGAMSAFGVGQAEWHPYWRNEQLLRVQPESVKVSFYLRRAGGGQPGRALLVVSNLSAQAGQTAEVQLDPARLGLSAAAAAKDALRGEKLPLEQGRLSVPLPPMRMRLVRIE